MENTTGGCGCGHPEDTTTQDLTLTDKPGPVTAECPVMAGTPVVTAQAEAQGLYRDHEGQRYWFCCAGCAPAFDADPTRYAHAA